MILLIDNYDSFSWNLAHLFGALGADVVVRRNDELDADEAERLAPSHLVVSPGPGRLAVPGKPKLVAADTPPADVPEKREPPRTQRPRSRKPEPAPRRANARAKQAARPLRAPARRD